MNVEIVGLGTKINSKQTDYIREKIGKLENYLPRSQRDFARVEVRIKESWIKQLKQLDAEITLKLPSKLLVVRETADNLVAAIDNAEDILKVEIKKYKEIYASSRPRQRLVSRYRRRGFAV